MSEISRLVAQAEAADNVQVWHGFCAGSNWISNLIEMFDITPHEMRWYAGKWSHTYWLFRFELSRNGGARPEVLELMYESHWTGGVQITPYDQLLEATASGKVTCHKEYPIHLTPDKAWTLWRACKAIHGRPYDKPHLLAFYGWVAYWRRRNPSALTTVPKLPWFIDTRNDRYICSEFTQETAAAIGLDLCGNVSTPQTTSPNLQFYVLKGYPSLMEDDRT